MTQALNVAQYGSVGATKNRIINGAMVIDQRNAGASVTPASGAYTLDRWQYAASQASKFTVQQTPSATETGYATRVGAGFANYLGMTVASSVSVGASDYFLMQQSLEGFNTSDLAWGTANAKTVTLSFWVYSSLTGTFGGALTNYARSRSYPFSYSIPAANTWTQISVTIAGDTSGTWVGSSNAGSATLTFGLGVGSTYSGAAGSWSGGYYFSATGAVSVVGTNGATFYITGVQLEKGSTATSFDYRPYGTELALCQRYCFVGLAGLGGYAASSTITASYGRTAVTMRTSPTATATSISYGNASGLVLDQLAPDRYRNYFTVTSAGGGDCTYTLKLESEL